MQNISKFKGTDRETGLITIEIKDKVKKLVNPSHRITNKAFTLAFVLALTDAEIVSLIAEKTGENLREPGSSGFRHGKGVKS
jgi:hypothetical protein